jgi:hypothetical protein
VSPQEAWSNPEFSALPHWLHMGQYLGEQGKNMWLRAGDIITKREEEDDALYIVLVQSKALARAELELMSDRFLIDDSSQMTLFRKVT